jgi:hypothetical protein
MGPRQGSCGACRPRVGRIGQVAHLGAVIVLVTLLTTVSIAQPPPRPAQVSPDPSPFAEISRALDWSSQPGPDDGRIVREIRYGPRF